MVLRAKASDRCPEGTDMLERSRIPYSMRPSGCVTEVCHHQTEARQAVGRSLGLQRAFEPRAQRKTEHYYLVVHDLRHSFSVSSFEKKLKRIKLKCLKYF